MLRRAATLVAVVGLLLAACAPSIDGTASADRYPGVHAGADAAASATDNAPDDVTATRSGAETSEEGSADAEMDASASVLATSASVAVVVPDGFAEFNYFGYRGVGPDARCPEDIPQCVGIDIYSVMDCPTGATILLDYYKEASNPVTHLAQVTGTSAPIPAGGIQTVFIGIPESIVDADPYGYIADIHC